LIEKEKTLASNTKKKKAIDARKEAKKERNKSDVVTLASKRRDQRENVLIVEEKDE
jgi:hypothetical protein